MLRIVLFGGVILFVGSGTFLGVQASQYDPKIVANTQVGLVPVGGLSKVDAAKKLRVYWEAAKLNKITLLAANLKEPLAVMSPTELGVVLDDVASTADLPLDTYVDKLKEQVTSPPPPEPKTFPLKFKQITVDFKPLVKKYQLLAPANRPAKVKYVKGVVVATPEASSSQIKVEGLSDLAKAVVEAGKTELKIDVEEAPKHIPDDELAKIKEVVASYSTNFASSNAPRSSNIRLASSKWDGLVLLPGEKATFNTVVGKRTLERGFKEAGVLKAGRHDVGIGGGICQVSGTLYNAVLLSDLTILERNNHSTPVPYLPAGRDATVDFGTLDFAFENSMDSPIAVATDYTPGRLTFRILGTKDANKSVKIVTKNHKVWDRGEIRVVDRTLRPGSTKVESGSRAHSVDTYRLVYEEGKLVRTDSLGHSDYVGAPTKISYNPAPKPVVVPGAITAVNPQVKPGVATQSLFNKPLRPKKQLVPRVKQPAARSVAP